MTLSDHPWQQVQPHGVADSRQASQLQRQVTGTAGHVYGCPVECLSRQRSGLPFPATVHTKSHQVVHQVVATGDAGEQVGDVALLLSPLEFSHGASPTRLQDPGTASFPAWPGPDQEQRRPGPPQSPQCPLCFGVSGKTLVPVAQLRRPFG